jgi:S-phase kinase-associated protein 1
VSAWDAAFIDLPVKTLFDTILAANYLHIPDLLDLGCAKLASMLKNKSPEEIKETFGIELNTTEEEEEQIKKDNPWIFEIN